MNHIFLYIKDNAESIRYDLTEQHPHLKFNPNNIERELYRASSVSIPTYSHKVGTVSNAIDNGIGLSRNGFGHGPKLSWGSWE